MDLGKPIRIIEVPEETPARQPVERPEKEDDGKLLPLPANWPKRVAVPAES